MVQQNLFEYNSYSNVTNSHSMTQTYTSKINFHQTTSCKDDHNLSFIDLFAGIGGFHLALHKLKAKCVFASEIDKHARKTYEHNFKKHAPHIFLNNHFNDDIKTIAPQDIPNFDILCAGFPCQPFSQAGLKLGFADSANGDRGNLFFTITSIIKAKQPKAFILENVQHLLKHDSGNTFNTIKKSLLDLGYTFYSQVLKASDYGLPQNRPRVFMVGFKNDHIYNFTFPKKQPLLISMSDILGGVCNKKIGFTLRVGGKGSAINDRRNWEHYYVNGNIKRIGLIEAKQMQGFPSDFEFPVSQSQAMKQLGNSVAINTVELLAKQVISYILTLDKENYSILNLQITNKI